MKSQKLRVKLIKSLIGICPKDKVRALTLGLRRLNKEVILPKDAAMLGIIKKISHLIEVKEE